MHNRFVTVHVNGAEIIKYMLNRYSATHIDSAATKYDGEQSRYYVDVLYIVDEQRATWLPELINGAAEALHWKEIGLPIEQSKVA